MMLIYEPQQQFSERQRPTEDSEHWGAWRSYHQALVDAGIYVSGGPLEAPDTTATTIRVRGGERQVQDGPYADTKEQLGGFIILELPTLDAALDWASRCPAVEYGVVEVRPLADLTRIFGAGHKGQARG